MLTSSSSSLTSFQSNSAVTTNEEANNSSCYGSYWSTAHASEYRREPCGSACNKGGGTCKKHNYYKMIKGAAGKADGAPLKAVKRFADAPGTEWSGLFSEKASQCETFFDFSMVPSSLSAADIQNREVKGASLGELLWIVSEHGEWLGEAEYRQIFYMFAKNVFRSLPPRQNPVGDAFDPEDDEPVYDPSWPHLHLAYEIFIRLIEGASFNVNTARQYVDQLFVTRLLCLFDVEDPRERDMVKTAVHRVYGKFLNLRAFIRKSMRHIFYEFIYEDERHNVSEMLEILGSIVNGFAVPLREEHKIFLERALIPLHKNRLLPIYFQQLSLCIVQFAEKDCMLIEKIILALLRIWPKTNTTKEIMFLIEIEEVLDVAPQECFASFMVPLFQQLTKCISSSHFQVSERALQYWNNEYIISLISEHCQQIMPIVLPVMLQYSREHWNKNVQLSIFSALKTLMDMDPKLYEQISNIDRMSDTIAAEPPSRERDWSAVKDLARRNSIELAIGMVNFNFDSSNDDDNLARRKPQAPPQQSSSYSTTVQHRPIVDKTSDNKASRSLQ